MDEDGRELVPCRAETRNPEHDWEATWHRARLPGLGSELMSFLFKVVHDLLPTQERVSRTSPAVNGVCRMCPSNDTEDLEHALVSCEANQGIGLAVLDSLPLDRRVQGQHALKLQLPLEDHQELSVVWFLAAAWSSMWGSRKMSRRPELYRVRADLEAKVSLLRETRHSESAAEITTMISKL